MTVTHNNNLPIPGAVGVPAAGQGAQHSQARHEIAAQGAAILAEPLCIPAFFIRFIVQFSRLGRRGLPIFPLFLIGASRRKIRPCLVIEQHDRIIGQVSRRYDKKACQHSEH